MQATKSPQAFYGQGQGSPMLAACQASNDSYNKLQASNPLQVLQTGAPLHRAEGSRAASLAQGGACIACHLTQLAASLWARGVSARL